MRIGIIAMGRSGGYDLGKWISNELGYEYIHEPIRNGISIEGKGNIVVKWLISEWNEIGIKPEMDKWIGLWRENLRECSISMVKAGQSGNWRREYEITNEWLRENESLIQSGEENIKRGNIEIQKLKLEFNTTYESIYNSKEGIQKIKEYIGIENGKWEWLLDNRNRLRGKQKSVI